MGPVIVDPLHANVSAGKIGLSPKVRAARTFKETSHACLEHTWNAKELIRRPAGRPVAGHYLYTPLDLADLNASITLPLPGSRY